MPTLLTILLGVLLVALITPLAQFLTIMTVNADVETATPVGWAVGLVFSLALCAGVIRLIARRDWLPRAQLVVLYSMLTIAVPVMNLGLVRQMFWSLIVVVDEYLLVGTSTYRTAYQALDTRWYPVVPSAEGLAWGKAERLLRLLEDRSAAAVSAAPARLDPGSAASDSAIAPLRAALASVDEFTASQLPANLAAMDDSSRLRLDRQLAAMTATERQATAARVAALEPEAPALMALVARLSSADRTALCRLLSADLLGLYRALPAADLARIRGDFVYRLTRVERVELISHDGRDGRPNANLAGMSQSLWGTPGQQRAKQARTWRANVHAVIQQLPWALWRRPVLLWSGLCGLIFGLYLCLAHALARSWIVRENLAFPLVDVAESVVGLGPAADVDQPRNRLMWAVGLAVGFTWLTVEALGHYGFVGGVHVTWFDLTKQVFAQSAALREMTGVIFVLSPVVLGLAYLISLEISFSVWCLFLVLNVAFMCCRLANVPVTDPYFTGWAGGRFFPYWMDQLLGASASFCVILLLRSRARLGAGDAAARRASVRRAWLAAGLGAAVVAMLVSQGFSKPGVLVLVALAMGVQLVAALRVRAETGLHTQHVSYEFAKLPMVFGLTGWMGAELYTRFIGLAFLPMSLLGRLPGQHLENLALAHRHRVAPRVIAVAAVAAFVTALAVGVPSFLIFSYYLGECFFGGTAYPGQGAATAFNIARYPLWVSHFFGESGLDKFTQVHLVRVGYVGLGAGLVALLALLRRRFLRFPLHPIGYLLILLSIYYEWVSPYVKGDGQRREASWIWGSVFMAWLIKTLVIKYGGMALYRRTRPAFIGLVVGAVLAVFAWNATHLVCQAHHAGAAGPGAFSRHFVDKPPFSPRFY